MTAIARVGVVAKSGLAAAADVLADIAAWLERRGVEPVLEAETAQLARAAGRWPTASRDARCPLSPSGTSSTAARSWVPRTAVAIAKSQTRSLRAEPNRTRSATAPMMQKCRAWTRAPKATPRTRPPKRRIASASSSTVTSGAPPRRRGR